jgi:hypothetical protein
MGNIISLRKARKQKTRADKLKSATTATAVTGIKKPERARVTRLKQMADSTLDGHKRDGET